MSTGPLYSNGIQESTAAFPFDQVIPKLFAQIGESIFIVNGIWVINEYIAGIVEMRHDFKIDPFNRGKT